MLNKIIRKKIFVNRKSRFYSNIGVLILLINCNNIFIFCLNISNRFFSNNIKDF